MRRNPPFSKVEAIVFEYLYKLFHLLPISVRPGMMSLKTRSKVTIILLLLLSLAVLAGPASALINVCNVKGSNQYHLTAGRTIPAGYVTIWNDSSIMYAKYETIDGWLMTSTNLEIQDTLADVPQTKGGPIVGKFTFAITPGQPQNVILYQIPLSLLPPNDGTLIVVAHATVIRDGVTNTAWGIDTCPDREAYSNFPGKNWATYFQYRW
jgi:hypothetical protein